MAADRREPTLTLTGWRRFVDTPAAIVATSTIREVARQGRLLTLLNRREISARRGLIVSGQQATGKTTALQQLGRTHELMVRQRYPSQLALAVA